MRFETQRGVVQHHSKQIAPFDLLERLENRVARIAKAASEFEWPDALLVHDRVQIDIAAIPLLSEKWRELRQGLLEEFSTSSIGDDRSHLAREFPEIARKEPFVLPIEAG